MNDNQFKELMAMDYQRALAHLSIIHRYSGIGGNWTFYMRDAAKQFTEEQLKELTSAFMTDFRQRNGLECVMDFTTEPPY